MKAITSNTEKLELGVNYTTRLQETWRGVQWTSFNAKIENASISCISLEQLQDRVLNWKFKTPEIIELEMRANQNFYNK